MMPGASAKEFAEFSRDEALAYSQAAIGAELAGVELTRSDGSTVAISDYRGKPLVISMIYSSCHHVCPSTTQNLRQVVDKARSALGDESFRVLSVGFDTANDSPERMAEEVRRLVNGIAERSDVAVAHVVDENEDDVGLRLSVGRNEKRDHGTKQGENRFHVRRRRWFARPIVCRRRQ